jgi:Ca-activated chloride channel family protein
MDGVRSALPATVEKDVTASALGTARRFFRHIHQRGSTLAAIDTSGSMSAVVPGTEPPQTRLQIAVAAALQGVRLFAHDDLVGLWMFASKLDGTKGYRELTPVVPLDSPGRLGTHLDDLIDAQQEVVPRGDTALYSTTLAAFRHQNANFVDGKLNQVVILTDGRDDNPGDPDAISLEKLLRTLRAEYRPDRPVGVITIAYGGEADVNALRQISDATHARSYVSADPRDVLGVFIDAVTQAGE